MNILTGITSKKYSDMILLNLIGENVLLFDKYPNIQENIMNNMDNCSQDIQDIWEKEVIGKKSKKYKYTCRKFVNLYTWYKSATLQKACIFDGKSRKYVECVVRRGLNGTYFLRRGRRFYISEFIERK